MTVGLPRKQVLAFGVLAAAAIGGYLIYSAQASGSGFPLDDAWIHQVYARNLTERGEWAFNPGQPSAGATSPLWVILLAVGYWLGLAPFVWTFLLGWLSLFVLGVAGAAVFRLLAPEWAHGSVWVGALLILEFHSVWSAGSGMETIVFTTLCITVLAMVLNGKNAKEKTTHWFAGGLLTGVAVLVRPEGLTLIAPLLLAALLIQKSGEKIKLMAALLIGFALLFLPYLLFNHAISGSWWPNTFYAKQAEYAELLAHPFFIRLAQLSFQVIIGPGVLLTPGLFYFIYRGVREKNWLPLMCLVWVMGFLVLYALRLPVTYQHGRYVMPVIPIFILLSSAGLARWIQLNSVNLWRRVVSKAWVGAVALGTLVFYGLGAPAYANDVAFINTEMLATASWVRDNTRADALIAAHDIGALGYFAQRPILDLAGLTSPEIIPFIRDETRLADYLSERNADYLVTFPGWYPQLTSGAEQLFQTTGLVSPALGGENMAVYRWPD